MLTIKDVAKKSGFSVATVSAVVNGLPVVSPKAKEQIQSAIKELGYRPNRVARSLKNSKTSSLAMIVRDVTNPFYPEVIMGFEDVAWSNNYEVFLCNTENNPEREKKYIDNLIGRRVDGVVIATSFIQRENHYDRLLENGIPYVFLNRRPEQLLDHEYFVGSDNAAASEKAVLHLTELGYKDILYMSGPLNLYTFKKRYEGFLRTMDKMGLPVGEDRILFSSDFMEKSGSEHAKRILGYEKMPEAIFCSNDLLAFGVHQTFKEAGMRIPEDVALIGLDNNRYSHLIDLSTVEPQNNQMGRKAGEVLLGLLKIKDVIAHEQKEIILEPRLIIRKSSGADARS
ncbi:MAG: LacI family transcriptional regulator [Cohnella sp.]|nr:LacI family transcriptional regulator [Cohnella sp.]